MNVAGTLRNIWEEKNLRRKILVTLVILLVFRFISHIPAAGIDLLALRRLFAGSPLLSLLDVFSGGTLANFSVMALGLNPYINASIIFQLLGVVFPQIEEMARESEAGREKLNQYTRWLTVPLSAMQAVGVYLLLRGQGVVGNLGPLSLLALLLTMVTGTILAMWLGELISEYGVGNGISVLIFAAIIGRLPVVLSQTAVTAGGGELVSLAVIGLLAVAVILAVVAVNEAVREIPVQYARRARGGEQVAARSHLPIRLNQAGVIPIIFAVSLVLLPSMVSQFLSGVGNATVVEWAQRISGYFRPGSLVYSGVYFLLVVGFTFFYTTVVFNPEKIADDLKKQGGFVPGIRPGMATQEYLSYVSSRITVVGAVFLGLVAVLPSLMQEATEIAALALGGTGVLIVVSVILETAKQVEAQLVMRSYERFLG